MDGGTGMGMPPGGGGGMPGMPGGMDMGKFSKVKVVLSINQTAVAFGISKEDIFFNSVNII